MVKSYKIMQLRSVSREVPIFGECVIESFLHQGMLRPPTQTFDFSLVECAQPFNIPAMVQYVNSNPQAVLVSAQGSAREERVYGERVLIRHRLDIAMIVDAEVIHLETGRCEYETTWQSRTLRYYLAKDLRIQREEVMSWDYIMFGLGISRTPSILGRQVLSRSESGN